MSRFLLALSRPSTLVVCLLGVFILTAPAAAKRKKKDKIGQVAGVVLDQQGQKLADIDVSLIDPGTGEVAGHAVTDKAGVFDMTVDMTGMAEMMPDTADGAEAEAMPAILQLQLELHGEGYAPFSNGLQLTAGERLDIQVTLLDETVGRRNEAIAVYNEGAQLHGAGEMEEAAAKFRQAIEIDPDVAQPYLGLADIALVLGRPEAGLESVQTFLELEPDDTAGQRLAYEIYRALGRMDEAKKLAELLGIETADRDLAIQVFNEGAVASQKGELETALEKFERAVEMDPELGPAWAGIASIHYNRRELESAVEPAARAVELQPDHEQSRRIYFLVLDGLGKVEAAVAWESYRAMNQPAALGLLYLRADLDFRNNGIDASRTALQTILAVDADYAKAHLLLGKIYASTDAAKAKAHLKKFIELAPADDPDIELAQSMIGYLE